MTQANLRWVDRIKAIALIWIVLNHVIERVFGYPLIANPNPGWPPLSDRVSQLAPLTGLGAWTLPVNALRYLGWFGDQGVQLFLIVSGFGLTWGLLHSNERRALRLASFYKRRAERIYPLWWGFHLLFALTWLLVGWGMAATDLRFYLSLAGVRITPELIYYFSPAWWYIGLLVQLYLVYPFLWDALRRRGPAWFLAMSCLVGFIARGLGLLYFDHYLDAWNRGAVFITRLPEFAFGMGLAAFLHAEPASTERWLRARTTTALALVAYVAGTALSLTVTGMTVAPFLLGIGAFGVLYPWLSWGDATGPLSRLTGWIGQHSYSLYLAHHPLILVLVPEGTSVPYRSLLGAGVALVLMVLLALGMERGVELVRAAGARLRQRAGTAGVAAVVVSLAVVVGLLLLGAELAVRRFAPQEILGWGERPSLEPDPRFGWHLVPSRETRLRWEGYDYRVTANALGFPGPDHPLEAGPGTWRVLTTGDAFTSAEGVDTGEAWPRKLEQALGSKLDQTTVEVLNFAITGYGPRQYAAVVEEFAPRYRPQTIVVAMYLNDFQDVLLSDEQFHAQIGFNLADPGGWKALARFRHLSHFLRWRVAEPARAWLRRQPDPRGYFLAGFPTLERRPDDEREYARQLVSGHLTRIVSVAHEVGADVVVALVPAPVEVCRPADLRYFPSNVSLDDAARFDPDASRKATAAMALSLGVGFVDLLPVLRSSPGGCPYQPDNLHWLASGHELVANHLAEVLAPRRDQATEPPQPSK